MNELRVIIAAVMAAGSLVCLGLVAHSVARIESTMRQLHLQQENIIAMLLHAGFRPAHTFNWGDDADATRVRGEPDHTQYDWRDPSGDVSG